MRTGYSSRPQDPASRFLPFRNLNVLLTDQTPPELGWLSPAILRSLPPEAEWIFLGLLDDVAHFSIDLSKSANAADRVERETGWRFEDCRTAGETMSGPNTGLLSHARAQLDWNLRHGFCSVCGHATDKKRGGQARQCPRLQRPALPAHRPGGHHRRRRRRARPLPAGPKSRGRLQRMRAYSALAGFMDQGEAIEEAVAREVMEEAGIRVKNVRYHSSQPWPFPSSLMIGCLAEADTTDINMDDEEMTDVRWFDRSEVLLALEGRSEELTVPGPIAIAHHLIKAWATGAPTG